jgi:hypothetical protein
MAAYAVLAVTGSIAIVADLTLEVNMGLIVLIGLAFRVVKREAAVRPQAPDPSRHKPADESVKSGRKGPASLNLTACKS